MQALDPRIGRGQPRGALLEEPLAGEAARGGQPGQRPLVLDQEPGGLPTPILVAIATSLARSTGPGRPSSSGIVIPRSRIRRTQARIEAGSKVRLLTTWVAYRRLSHIDCTVRSSVMQGATRDSR